MLPQFLRTLKVLWMGAEDDKVRWVIPPPLADGFLSAEKPCYIFRMKTFLLRHVHEHDDDNYHFE